MAKEDNDPRFSRSGPKTLVLRADRRLRTRLAVDSIFARDYPVAMAVVLLFVLFYAAINLLVDVVCALVDPRIRAGVQR